MKSVGCIFCYESIEIPDSFVGERVRCPRCKLLTPIEGLNAPAGVSESPDEIDPSSRGEIPSSQSESNDPPPSVPFYAHFAPIAKWGMVLCLAATVFSCCLSFPNPEAERQKILRDADREIKLRKQQQEEHERSENSRRFEDRMRKLRGE